MTERCEICESEKTMGHCWRLTCPMNGGSMKLLELVRKNKPEKEGKLL